MILTIVVTILIAISPYLVRVIKKIIICGGSANLLGLPEYLSEKLEVQLSVHKCGRTHFHLKRKSHQLQEDIHTGMLQLSDWHLETFHEYD